MVLEPLGLINSELLDPSGAIVGDTALAEGRVLVLDWGYHTLNLAIVDKLVPVRNALRTFELALGEIQALINAAFGREYPLYEIDQAVQTGQIKAFGRYIDLPDGWDAPLHELARRAVARIEETVGTGVNVDVVLVGEGLADEPPPRPHRAWPRCNPSARQYCLTPDHGHEVAGGDDGVVQHAFNGCSTSVGQRFNGCSTSVERASWGSDDGIGIPRDAPNQR